MSFSNFNHTLKIKIEEVLLSKLLPHEKVDFNEVNKIVLKSNTIKDFEIPLIVVCNKTNMIIDGHHRFEALKILGYKKFPIIYVNYFSDYICCSLSKKILKEDLINYAINENVKKVKYSNHHIYDIKKSSWVEIINISNNNFIQIRDCNN